MPEKTVLREIHNAIKAHEKIMLFRHIRIDGDCVGAAKGLQEILRLTYPEKEVLLVDDERSEQLAFICGEEDAPVPDSWYSDALGIVLDTATLERIASKKHALCGSLIKIDHHNETKDEQLFGKPHWVEPHRSSVCEMIVEYYDAFRHELKINARAATLLYLGIVTDSGRFQFDCTDGDTLRYAAMMLDIMLKNGVDTQWLYANLYLRDLETTLKMKQYVFSNVQFTPHGVASIYISTETCKQLGISHETASSALNELDCFKNCICWIAFIENEHQDTIRVRIRSRFADINPLAARRQGGGHTHASAAVVRNMDEVRQLLDEADELIKDYKATHTGWL